MIGIGNLKSILITGRTTKQGKALEIGKLSQDYFDEAAGAWINEEDMENLGLSEDYPIKISSGFGSIVVKCKKGEVDRGMTFMPVGPWANMIIGSDTEGTGLPKSKGIQVDLSKTTEDHTTLDVILETISKKNISRDLSVSSIPCPAMGTRSEEAKTIMKDITCTFCGCLCDDLELSLQGGRITDVRVGCQLARSKILNYRENRAKPAIRRNGEFKEVSIDEAIDKAAKTMSKADFPLIYGLSSTEIGAQKLAIELAELTGGSIDTTSSVCHGPSTIAAQDVGIPKITLGEIRNRADFVVYWGCNPSESHIRHTTRYSATPVGMFRKTGRKERTLVYVDVRKTKTAKIETRWRYTKKPLTLQSYVNGTYQISDILVKIEPGKDYELISALRATLKGHEVGDVAGVPSKRIKELAEKMKSCEFGVILFGLGLSASGAKHMNVDAALRLVRDLNDYTKFSILPMRGHYNVAGADEVMGWTTGYPFAVNFSRGHPVYNPGEFSAVDLLNRRECDAALILASDPVAHFPVEASKHLAKIPTIVIDPKINLTSLVADVLIPSAMTGIESDGTAYRMDCVPIGLRKTIDSPFLSDREILEKIIRRIKD